MATMSERATSFGALAERYDRVRPGYPEAVIDAVLADSPERLADVGAGTGKLTVALAQRVPAVIAVEPDPGMRAVLTARCPAVSVRAGSAEALPLVDAEVDAIVFGQSWHWVDVDRAVAESHRALGPNGTLSMLWNRLDAGVDWVGDIERITTVGRLSARTDRDGNPPELAGFAGPAVTEAPWRQRLSHDDLVDLAGTWSAVSTASDDDRARILAGVRARAATVEPGDGGPDGSVDLAYLCTVWTYRRI